MYKCVNTFKKKGFYCDGNMNFCDPYEYVCNHSLNDTCKLFYRDIEKILNEKHKVACENEYNYEFSLYITSRFFYFLNIDFLNIDFLNIDFLNNK